MVLKIIWKLFKVIRNKFLFLFFYLKYFPRFNCSVFRCDGFFCMESGAYVGRGSILLISNNATLKIGKNTYIGEYSNIRVDKEIHIGDNCKIAQFVTIVDGDYDFRLKPLSFKNRKISPVYIGNDVFIGSGSVILRGCRVKDQSVIGANSVFNRTNL